MSEQIEAERDELRAQLARAVVLPADWRQRLWNTVERGHNHMYPGFDNVSMTELVAGLVVKALESWRAPVDADCGGTGQDDTRCTVTDDQGRRCVKGQAMPHHHEVDHGYRYQGGA